MPSPYAMDPRIESQRMRQFDPFALDDLGPETFTRPRDFDEPRNKARRAKEAQYLRGMPAPSTYQQPAVPGTSSRPKQYHQAVPF